MEKLDDFDPNSTGGSATPEISEEEQRAQEIKKATGFKHDLLRAIQNKNADDAVIALQKLRNFLLEIYKIDFDSIKKSRDTMHVAGGHWKKEFEKFFAELEKYPNPQFEIHLDGTNRLMIGMKENKPFVRLSPIDQIPKCIKNFKDMETSYNEDYKEDNSARQSTVEL